MQKHVITKLSVLFLLAFSFAIAGQTAVYAQKTNAKTAVVDLNKLYQGLKELKALQTEAKNRTFEIQGQVKKKTADLEQLKNELNLAPIGSATYNEKKNKLAKLAIEMEVWQKFEQGKLQARDVTETAKLYERVLKAIGEIAKAKGIDLVLQKDIAPDFRKVQGAQLATAVTNKRVLFASDELDITSDVIVKMNADFENRKK